jgi:flagellar biosynthesis protein FlhG
MSDQATELRKLVLRAMRESQPLTSPAPRLILVAGGQIGVGVTTLAVNLAVALAEQGSRIVLIDADSQGAGIATLCGLQAQRTIIDVLAARQDFHEALQLGPAGIQVIPGRPGRGPEISSMALERLMRQISKLGRHADSVLVDVGNGANDLVRRIAQAADEVIVVSTTDSASVMDTYARIKLTLSEHRPHAVSLIVNRIADEPQSTDVFRRIDQSCQRFLGHGIEYLGGIPEDDEVPLAARTATPLLLARPLAVATQAIQQVAVALASRGPRGERERAAA